MIGYKQMERVRIQTKGKLQLFIQYRMIKAFNPDQLEINSTISLPHYSNDNFDFYNDVDIYLNLDQTSPFSSSLSQHFSMGPKQADPPILPLDKPVKQSQACCCVGTLSREIYQQETRTDKLNRYLRKKKLRVWKKKVSYASRQNIANLRERVKGRFASSKKLTANSRLSAECHDKFSLSSLNLGFKNQATEWSEP